MVSNTYARSVNPRATAEVIAAFSSETLCAPFTLRCAALMIDYLLIVSVPVVFLLFARFIGEDGSNLLNGQLNNFGWLIAILIGIANSLLLPVLIGQSVGKLLTRIRIVSVDGSEATAKRLILRQTAGYLLTILTLGLGFLFSVVNSSGRSLHDLLSATIVIQAEKQVVIRN